MIKEEIEKIIKKNRIKIKDFNIEGVNRQDLVIKSFDKVFTFMDIRAQKGRDFEQKLVNLIKNIKELVPVKTDFPKKTKSEKPKEIKSEEPKESKKRTYKKRIKDENIEEIKA